MFNCIRIAMTREVTRRSILKGAGTGLGALTLGTGAAAGARERHVVGTATTEATAAARSRAAEVHRELDFGHVGRAVAGRFPEEALEGLRKRPDVRYIERDGTYEAIAQTLPWGIDRVDADVVHANGETGGDNSDGQGGADVAIIDTGIDDDHPDLSANVGTGTAYVDCTGPNCNYDWSDDNDHGTHCAGIADAVDNSEGVVGVSTAATLHAVKVLDSQGSGYWSDIAAGIEWVADQGYDVANMSLGGSSGSSTVKDACQYAADNGVLLVAAAGNSGPCSDCVGYPAAYSTVVAVSATTESDSLASFSSTGPEVEIAAPGDAIYSTVIGGYDTFSGTSMASPHVAGAGAQLMDNGYTNSEARSRLTDTAEDIGLGSNESGSGLLDVEAAMADDSGSNNPPSVSWVNPSDGATVSGSVAIEIDASDDTDSGSDLTVEWQVDDGTWRTATYDSGSGTYTDSWDSTAVVDGDHSLDARATDTDGATSSESSVTVTVSNDTSESAPTVESYTVTEAGSPNPHAEITADWSVADADGNLDTVVVEVVDGSGSVVDSNTTDVGGSSASGTDQFKVKHAQNQTFDVTLTVSDTAGNSASATRTVTE